VDEAAGDPMTNLVANLREQASLVDRPYAAELMNAAADELERLDRKCSALAYLQYGKPDEPEVTRWPGWSDGKPKPEAVPLFGRYQALVSACTLAGFRPEEQDDPNFGGKRTVLVPMASEKSSAPTDHLTLTCEGCGATAELPKVGREKVFVSLEPANGWELYPNRLCPKCRK